MPPGSSGSSDLELHLEMLKIFGWFTGSAAAGW
jgi:hypothetical protein